jgi:hypothetical protein
MGMLHIGLVLRRSRVRVYYSSLGICASGKDFFHAALAINSSGFASRAARRTVMVWRALSLTW